MHQRSGGQHHSHGHHGYSQRQHGPQATVISDYIDKNLQENVALVLLDKNFQTCENIALYAVTDLMKEYMRELGKEIKSYTELNGRTESNLIDTLNALYNYDMPKEKLIEHMESRGRELSLTPYKYGYLEEHQFAMDRKVRSKMDAIQSIFSGGDQIGSTPANIVISNLFHSIMTKGFQYLKYLFFGDINTSQLPEYTKKLKTMSSIPSHLLNVLPSKLTFMADQTLAERETNPAYERMQRVQFKREIENSIQKVSEIQIDLSQQVNAQKQEQQVNLVEGAVEELKQEQAAEDVQMKDAEELPQPPINGIDEQQLPKDEANTQPKELVQQQEEESMQIDTSTIQAQQQQVEEQQKEVKQINSAKKKKEKKQPETVQNPNELWSFGVGQSDRVFDAEQQQQMNMECASNSFRVRASPNSKTIARTFHVYLLLLISVKNSIRLQNKKYTGGGCYLIAKQTYWSETFYFYIQIIALIQVSHVVVLFRNFELMNSSRVKPYKQALHFLAPIQNVSLRWECFGPHSLESPLITSFILSYSEYLQSTHSHDIIVGIHSKLGNYNQINQNQFKLLAVKVGQFKRSWAHSIENSKLAGL